MKKITQLLGFLTIFGLVLSCNDLDKSANNDTTAEQNTPKSTNSMSINGSQKTSASNNNIYMKAAIETCNCIQPMIEKAKHLKEFELNKQTAEKKKTAIEMEVMQPEIQKCSDEIRLKYSKINKSIDGKRMMEAVLRQCPDASTLFSDLVYTK